MARRAAPAMPTARQVEEALAAARRVDPDVIIRRIGPDGVEFEYPGRAERVAAGDWHGKPFGA